MTKFAAYVTWILFCESCKFGEKIYYSNWDNEFFLRDYIFIGAPCRRSDFQPDLRAMSVLSALLRLQRP